MYFYLRKQQGCEWNRDKGAKRLPEKDPVLTEAIRLEDPKSKVLHLHPQHESRAYEDSPHRRKACCGLEDQTSAVLTILSLIFNVIRKER